MGAQSLVKNSSQCYLLLLSYELLCFFPGLVVLKYIFWGAFTFPATPWFGLKIYMIHMTDIIHVNTLHGKICD